MKETTAKQVDRLTNSKIKEPIVLNRLFDSKGFAWFIFGLSILLMFIENFLKMNKFVGGWHIVSYLLLLSPLVYLVYKNELKNPYVKLFLPILLIMIVDMFVYSNEMVQTFVPIVFYLMVITLYLTSMHKVHSLYQTLLPNFVIQGVGFGYIGAFFDKLFVKGDNSNLYSRIGVAMLITIPFLGLFIALLYSADERFASFLTNLVDFHFHFDISYIFTVPFYLFIYMLLFVFSLSAFKNRTNIRETEPFDMLIVGIFLGMINLLFFTFLAFQFPFLFGEITLPNHTTLAEFAREGFFQLMMVMGIVVLIFLFIMRRFKGEKLSIFLLAGLLVQTALMGVVSLKKMYLYQSIKGATTLRYYVEWFDYFLIAVLVLGLIFILRKMDFRRLLDIVATLGVVSFTLVISLDVDAMVASHNIEKFKDNPNELDKGAISRLSIDALPAIQGTDIIINKSQFRDCSSFSEYHFGYCSKISKYGEKQYRDRYLTPYNAPKYIRHNNMSAKEIYQSCAGCHGRDGEQKALGKSAIIAGRDANRTIQQLQAYRRGDLSLYGMGGLMRGQVGSLSDEEINSLALYISQLKKGDSNESR